jgi:hypothetical protein
MKTNRHNETNQRSATPHDLSHTDIEDRKWAETLLAGENRLLEMLATGCTLSEILDALCRLIEDIKRISVELCWSILSAID